MSKILRKKGLIKLATIYLPLIVGLILTIVGTLYYIEVTRTYPPQILPKYGIINLASSEFSPLGTMRVTIWDISIQENYLDMTTQLSLEAKAKQVSEFSLQVPHRVTDAYGKISYMDVEKQNIYVDSGDAKVEWKPESDTSIITYNFKGESGISWYSVEIGFRWYDAIAKTGYSTYEILVPFSRVNDVAVDSSSGLVAINEETPVMLTIYLPADTQLVDSIPPPEGVVIDWQNSDVGIKSLVFNADVDFGMTPGWASLPSFKVAFDVPLAQDKYERLIFDSGLFLGIGIQFLLAGIFDAFKMKNTRVSEE